jgi:hypothetical protein
VPRVTREDVLRIIRRDFPARSSAKILAILDEYGVEPWRGERDRVQLAILKLSGGNVERVRHYTEIARSDYRDVIAPAEYPRFWEVGFVGIEDMSPAAIGKLKKDDWEQYRRWLSGESD